MDALEFAIRTARRAGNEILLPRFGTVQTLTWKSVTDAKTEADDLSDAFIRGEIESCFPNDGIYSEEQAEKPSRSGWRWIVDPLDGTLPFVTGINNHCAVSIARERDGELELGVIFAPIRHECFAARRGGGAFLNGHRIVVGNEVELNHIVMGLDSGKPEESKPELEAIHQRLLVGKDRIRADLKHGCASVPLALVAQGSLHAYLATSLELEDMAAAVILIREAGGKVTDRWGAEWQPGHRSILAANPISTRSSSRVSR